MRLDNRGQVSFYIILVFIIIIAVFLIYITISDVGYKISTNSPVIQKNDIIVLNVDINNGLAFDSILNVKFAYAIDKTGDYDLDYTIYDLTSKMSRTSSISETYAIKTENLDAGDYRIWTFLEYWINGKLERKYLSIDVEIIG